MEINSRVRKVTLKLLISEFTWIFNGCKNKCKFPDAWKHVLTVPIPNQGNVKEVINISLLPVTGKIMEC